MDPQLPARLVADTEPEYDTDFASDSDEYPEMYERAVRAKKNQPLGLHREYAPNWLPGQGIREIFQNWIDGMIESFTINPFEITYKIEDSELFWTICAYHPTTKILIGFAKHDNIKAEALKLGCTTKRNLDNYAGYHGEGLKIAALVLLKAGYQVRIESDSTRWDFNFEGGNGTELKCLRRDVTEKTIVKARDADAKRARANPARQAISNIWEDVTILIGSVYTRKFVTGKKVRVDHLKTWLQYVLVAQDRRDMIQTPAGDLLLDEEFKGRIYLKGFRVESGSASSKPLKYGYNLYQGLINRDRQRLSNPNEEAQILTKIWHQAITVNSHSSRERYVHMLRDLESQFGDVNLHHMYICKPMASLVLMQLNESDSHIQNGFYYNVESTDHVFAITSFLKRTPLPLPTKLWKMLNRYDLLSTPNEHRIHLLRSALVNAEPDTLHSASFKQLLKKALSWYSPVTARFNMIFKSGATADLDFLIDGQNLLLNDKYLDFWKTHETSSCRLSDTPNAKDDYPCDHVVVTLFSLIIADLGINDGTTQSSREKSQRDLSECFRQMPRQVRSSIPARKPHALRVTWTDLESDGVYEVYELDLKCRVILHRDSTCSDKREDLLNVISVSQPENAIDLELPLDSQEEAGCGCPCQIVSQKRKSAEFSNLLSEESYFPMVAGNHANSFYAYPPPSVYPNEPSVSGSPSGVSSQRSMNIFGEDDHSESKDSDEDDEIYMDEGYIPRSASPEVMSQTGLQIVEHRSSHVQNPAAAPLEDANYVLLQATEEKLKDVTVERDETIELLRLEEQKCASAFQQLDSAKLERDSALKLVEEANNARTQLTADRDLVRNSLERTRLELVQATAERISDQEEHRKIVRSLQSEITHLQSAAVSLQEHQQAMKSRQSSEGIYSASSPPPCPQPSSPVMKIENLQEDFSILQKKARQYRTEKRDLVDSMTVVQESIRAALKHSTVPNIRKSVTPHLDIMLDTLGIELSDVQRNNKRGGEEGGESSTSAEKRARQE